MINPYLFFNQKYKSKNIFFQSYLKHNKYKYQWVHQRSRIFFLWIIHHVGNCSFKITFEPGESRLQMRNKICYWTCFTSLQMVPLSYWKVFLAEVVAKILLKIAWENVIDCWDLLVVNFGNFVR